MGDAQPRDGDPAVDLFDRWLEHHGQARAPASGPATAAEIRTVDPAAAADPPADPPAPAPAPPAEEPVELLAAGSGTPGRGRGDHLDAGRAVLAALASPPIVPPVQDQEPAPPPELPGSAPVPAPPATRVPAEAADAVGRRVESTNVDFAPRPGSRRLTGLLLLAALGATGAAAYYAYEDPNTLTVGVSGTLAVLSLVLWAIRAGSATPQLSVRRGQLEIQAGGKRAVFDLTSQFTPVEVVGRPGQRGWKVVLDRPSQAPFVVDSSMVDPREFMEVLGRYRPEVSIQ
ncbi:MAG: hypothetical protein WKF79_11920 [Nocardioides sp.]